MSDGINIRFGKGPFDMLRDRGSFSTVSELVELVVKLKSFYISSGAKSKGSNGGVAVGLPHRNYSVFKQADPNKR